jgi:hypothetical protein
MNQAHQANQANQVDRNMTRAQLVQRLQRICTNAETSSQFWESLPTGVLGSIIVLMGDGGFRKIVEDNMDDAVAAGVSLGPCVPLEHVFIYLSRHPLSPWNPVTRQPLNITNLRDIMFAVQLEMSRKLGLTGSRLRLTMYTLLIGEMVRTVAGMGSPGGPDILAVWRLSIQSRWSNLVERDLNRFMILEQVSRARALIPETEADARRGCVVS